MKLRDIAERLGCRLVGNGELEIHGVAGLEQAKPGELTFLSNPRYRALLSQTEGSAVIVGTEEEGLKLACLVSKNPYLDFARALELFYQPPRPRPGIDPTAVIAASAKVGVNATIGACVVLGEDSASARRDLSGSGDRR
jgi:UDP-3-O-[3-hydroxymyristoyl] glucosamine N-acyltransferase